VNARGAPRALALALVLALGACRSGEREAVGAVRAYDDTLVAAFRTGDASGLRDVASEDEARRVEVLLAIKAERRVVLESALESFEVVRVEVPARGAALVDARERWRYLERPLDPGAAAGPPVVSAMTMRYHLGPEGGRLKVRQVESIASDGARIAPPGAGR
jgi:hypothetical protein